MSDNGERELVLGNRHLLTIFFVAALLCGVFFAVGYVVGGNAVKSSAAVAATDSAPAPISDGKADEPAAQSQSAGDAATTAQPPSADTGALPAAEPRMADNPAAAGSQPTAPVPATPAPVQPARSAPPARTATPVATPSASMYVSDPEKGVPYWQVTAAKRPNADDLVKALREAGLPAILANSSKPELFEVLVGPYHSAQTLAEAKRKLIDLGYNGIVLHKQ